MKTEEERKYSRTETSRQYYVAHKDELSAYKKKRYADNRDVIKAKSKKWYADNRDDILSRRRLRSKEHRLMMRNTALDALGGKCICCGETEPCFLSIDHINGGGREHRKTLGSTSIYEWLVKNDYPPGFQILCHNCNMAKGLYGYCPHEEGNH